MDNDKELKKKVKEDLFDFQKMSTLPIIKDNLNKFKNLNKLGLKADKILWETLNESKYNLDSKKPFNYDPSGLLCHDYKSLKRCAKYVFMLDKLLGTFFNTVPNYTFKRLRNQFMNNFADFGLMLLFVDFCNKRNIKILEFEPKNPVDKTKSLDFKILLNNREVYVECFSPIEGLIKGKGMNLESKIQNELKKHNISYLNYPLLLVINVSEPCWSGNFLNRGCISDNMFNPIRRTECGYTNYPQKFCYISAVLIKYGRIGEIHINPSLFNPLMSQEIKILSSNPSIFKRIIRRCIK